MNCLISFEQCSLSRLTFLSCSKYCVHFPTGKGSCLRGRGGQYFQNLSRPFKGSQSITLKGVMEKMTKQAELGVPHSEIQVELD